MPRSHVGFALQPFGFFDRNPTLNAPRPTPHGAAHCASGNGNGNGACACEH